MDEELAIRVVHRDSETLRNIVKRIDRLERLNKKIDIIFDELLNKRTEKSSQP